MPVGQLVMVMIMVNILINVVMMIFKGTQATFLYDYDGLPAYSHHDRFPPWWVFVRDDNGGNLSSDKIPPLTMLIINHYLTQSLIG